MVITFFFNIGEVCDWIYMNWKKIDNNFLLPIYRYHGYASYQKMSETDKV